MSCFGGNQNTMYLPLKELFYGYFKKKLSFKLTIFDLLFFVFPQQDKPVINRTASSQDVPVWAGNTANLSCVADGNPAPRYIWTNSTGHVATSEESGVLQVTPQDSDGFGPYTCTVENSKGKDSYDIRLVKVGMLNLIAGVSITFFFISGC